MNIQLNIFMELIELYNDEKLSKQLINKTSQNGVFLLLVVFS